MNEICSECGTEMELVDTTYSNITTKRCNDGDHTGNVYRCEKCEILWLENFLNNSKLEHYCY